MMIPYGINAMLLSKGHNYATLLWSCIQLLKYKAMTTLAQH